MRELLSDDYLLSGSKLSENEILEVHLRRFFGADAETVTNESVTDLFQKTRHTVMSTRAARDRYLHKPEVDRQIIIKRYDLGDRNLEKPGY